jgi:hypothetical protein
MRGFLSHARLGAGTVQRVDRAEPIISLPSVVSFQGVGGLRMLFIGIWATHDLVPQVSRVDSLLILSILLHIQMVCIMFRQ